MRTVKLGRSLNIFFATSIILPLIVISIFAMYYSTSFLNELSKNNNRQIAENLKVSVEGFFAEPEKDLEVLRDLLLSDQIQSFDKVNYNAMFEIFHKNQGQFHHYQIVDRDGTVSYSYPDEKGNVGFDFSSAEYVKQIWSGANFYWSRTYVDSRFGEISIDFALPLGTDILVGSIQLEQLSHVLESIIDDENVHVGITDSTGVYIIHSDYLNVEQRNTDPFVNQFQLNYDPVKINNDSYYGTILKSDYQGWNIVLYEHVSKQGTKVNRFLVLLTVIIVVSTLVVIAFGNRLNHMIITSLKDVVANTKEVAAGDYSIKKDSSAFEEFNDINSNFSLMASRIKKRENQIIDQRNKIESLNVDLEKRVDERTLELKNSNEKLEKTLKNLEETKEQLIESEKLASLGNLVAGLAHEINTPLGIILTVVTYMQDRTDKFTEKFKNGNLKRDELTKFVDSIAESEVLIYDNVTRTTDLLSSFKMISTDQFSNELRTINLRSYVENIVRGLEPNLKKSKIRMRLVAEEDIEIVTIPGSIYQVVVNLVVNAAVHGYDDQGGEIVIVVSKKGQQAEVIVEDFGKGISKENLKHIFEPFFTTARGKGGTGLGLNIAYNSVRKSLKGNINVVSHIDSGTRVQVLIPLKLDSFKNSME